MEFLWIALKTQTVGRTKYSVKNIHHTVLALAGFPQLVREQFQDIKLEFQSCSSLADKNKFFVKLLLNFGSVGAGYYTAGRLPEYRLKKWKAKGLLKLIPQPVVPIVTLKILVCWSRLVVEELHQYEELAETEREILQSFLNFTELFSTGMSMSQREVFDLEKFVQKLSET